METKAGRWVAWMTKNKVYSKVLRDNSDSLIETL